MKDGARPIRKKRLNQHALLVLWLYTTDIVQCVGGTATPITFPLLRLKVGFSWNFAYEVIKCIDFLLILVVQSYTHRYFSLQSSGSKQSGSQAHRNTAILNLVKHSGSSFLFLPSLDRLNNPLFEIETLVGAFIAAIIVWVRYAAYFEIHCFEALKMNCEAAQ